MLIYWIWSSLILGLECLTKNFFKMENKWPLIIEILYSRTLGIGDLRFFLTHAHLCNIRAECGSVALMLFATDFTSILENVMRTLSNELGKHEIPLSVGIRLSRSPFLQIPIINGWQYPSYTCWWKNREEPLHLKLYKNLSNESYTTDDATSFQYLTLAERERERKGSEGER